MNAPAELSKKPNSDLLRLSTDVVASYLANNSVSAVNVPEIIRSVHELLAKLGESKPDPAPTEKLRPAVPISKSVQEDYIVCLDDGKKLKMLKRYLRSKFNLSPEEYRRKWGLPNDYPIVAPAYANRRSEFAKQIGLGRGVRRRKD